MVLHCHELEHEDDGAINYFDVVGVPDSRRNEVDSPSYPCPAEITYESITTIKEDPTEDFDPNEDLTYESSTTSIKDVTAEASDSSMNTSNEDNRTEFQDSMSSSECNVSFCKETSDCCSGTCLPYGRCGEPDLATNGGWSMDQASQLLIAVSWVLPALVVQ